MLGVTTVLDRKPSLLLHYLLRSFDHTPPRTGRDEIAPLPLGRIGAAKDANNLAGLIDTGTAGVPPDRWAHYHDLRLGLEPAALDRAHLGVGVELHHYVATREVGDAVHMHSRCHEALSALVVPQNAHLFVELGLAIGDAKLMEPLLLHGRGIVH